MNFEEIDIYAAGLSFARGGTVAEWRAVLTAGVALGWSLDTMTTLASGQKLSASALSDLLAVAQRMDCPRLPAVHVRPGTIRKMTVRHLPGEDS